jgi:hypothetical protein
MRSLVVFYKLRGRQRVYQMFSEDKRTLQLFLQPPALSSAAFGGLHFQDHSKETD